MPNPAELPALLAAIAAGDEAAFERFFRAWYPRMARYAAQLLGDSDKGEDAVQEVFLELWRGRERLPDAAAMSSYLHRATRNRALNQLRGRQNQSLDIEGVAPPSIPPIAEVALLEAELSVVVERAIALLPPRTAEVFRLSREGGLTYPEIATALEISVKTVETLMGRALQSLRESLRPRLLDPN